MANPHGADQSDHMAGVEDIPDQSLGSADIETSFMARHDPCSILAPVLEDGEAIVERLIDPAFGNYPNDPAHNRLGKRVI